MKLYFSPGACSLSPHIILREAGIDFSLQKVDTSIHKTADGVDFYGINPKGQVPTMELDDGQILTEGSIIAQYVVERAENRDLLPASGMARYRVLEWQNYITSELHKSFAPLFDPAMNAEGKTLIAGLLRKKFAWVNSRLEGSRYLTGDTFTVADAYLFTVSGWARHVNLDISDFAHLQGFIANVKARPHVQAALKAEGLPV
ncbi:glutathione transferase GstA [Undibacterium sp. CY18W]|uniref:Glutathione transferase GstA n=1 Tax=Undibacterium hunanense TaxID=2762292 RepID=A0ABR6ZWF7_9BURK|nr:glutathione transferase GstA [Undibacterium hunanense]MBC3920206.1 glutathione transferase GstA [Undibacterium hunanense]